MISTEHFGEISGEKLLLSGDEEKRESDQEETSVAMSSASDKKAPKAVSIQEPTSRSVNEGVSEIPGYPHQMLT